MTSDFERFLAFFRVKLDDLQKTKNTPLSESEIKEAVNSDPFLGHLPNEVLQKITRYLLSMYEISQDEGSIITSECKPWLTDRKTRGDIDDYYWPRLRRYFLEKGVLPPNVVSTLDTVTDGILDCCGNPAEDGPWNYRGMVIGHVQSGKTTNYSGLITKAADAGYKVIFLLAGITNSLRSQTQQRIDDYFIGRKSVFNAAAQAELEILKFSEEGAIRWPDFGTTREQDFNKNLVAGETVLASLKVPKIFVLKKNKSVLENLNLWIAAQARGTQIDEPVLVIDDEADNASINTQKDPNRTTTINRLIRELMEKFSRSSYVGYTATPFANIFIEPDSTQNMKEADLFPRNFIKALSPPKNYSGATRIFSDEGDLGARAVVVVDDYEDILPLKHRKSDDLPILPTSLYYAVRCFVLARAVRFLRGNGNQHCTMMINVSRFNDMQEKVHGHVYDYLESLKSAIAVSALARQPFDDEHLVDLRDTFNEEYYDLPLDETRREEEPSIHISFEDLLPVLKNSSASIGVQTVNMRGGALDYEKQKDSGFHVIAIGGLALSRGLTLEGLVTTYLLRNVGASDTLMQMARWFGYRPGYEKLCRMFMPEGAIDHYREIDIAIEELRAEVNYMDQSNQSPYEFGLKVRQSPTGIRITAANKMRSATELQLAPDFSGRYVQGHAIFNSDRKNREHIALISDFLANQGPPTEKTDKGQPYWKGVDGADIVDLLGEFRFPEKVYSMVHLNGRKSLLGEYIRDRASSELSAWDVTVTARRNPAAGFAPVPDLVDGYVFHPSERSKMTVESGMLRFSGASNKVGDQDAPQLGLTPDEIERANSEHVSYRGDKTNRYSKVRTRPLLIIFVVGINASGKTENGDSINVKDYALSLGLCLPTTRKPIREQTYQVNPVFRASMQSPYDDEDEEADDVVEGDV
jgi:hypothetical protein